MHFDPDSTIFIIDGSAFLYRAYYSMRPLTTSRGIPVQAVYGFCRMLKRLIDRFHPRYLALAWDSRGKTVRHELYEHYKSTRQVPPSDLSIQKEIIQKLATAMGIAQFAREGVEADDLIASLVHKTTEQEMSQVIVTSDKDMMQLLSANTVIFDPFKNEIIDPATFLEKRGFPVEKLPFYFALLGDSSDNIPGVRGIGEKGATELVTQFDSLQNLYENLQNVGKLKTRDALASQRDNAFLSYDLFVLRLYELDFKLHTIKFYPGNWNNARDLFQELEFKSLLKDMGAAAQQESVTEKIEFLKKYNLQTVTTQEQLAEVLNLIEQHGFFGFDTETNGGPGLNCTLVGVSISCQPGTAYYIPCGHVGTTTLSAIELITALKPYCENEQYKKYLQNTKFDQLVLSQYGIECRGIAFDTMLAAHLIRKDWERVNLKELSRVFLQEPMLTFSDVVTANKYRDFSYVPLELATLYAAFDAHQTLRLVDVFAPELEKIGMHHTYYDLELPLSQILYAMEHKGIRIDTQVLDTIRQKVTAEMDTIYAQVMTHVGHAHPELNLNSPRQVETVLFSTLGLPPRSKSAGGTAYSTRSSVLADLAHLHEVPKLIMKYRELAKIKNGYVDALPQHINPKTGRIHTSYSQISTATGRLASSDPNLQNIPVDSEGLGILVRSAFIAEDRHVLISADYSQIELRVTAEFSQDEYLINAFKQGRDIHAEVAAGIFNIPVSAVSNRQRQVGKAINFGLIYGQTPYGLSQTLDIPLKDAKQYIEQYFATYPRVAAWIQETIARTKERGYVTTMSGRRRYIPAIYEKNKTLYEEACRIAVNTVVQGSAADLIKYGMIALDRHIREYQLPISLLLQIHDELVIETPESFAQQARTILQKILQTITPGWETPLVTSTRIGKNWMEITK